MGRIARPGHGGVLRREVSPLETDGIQATNREALAIFNSHLGQSFPKVRTETRVADHQKLCLRQALNLSENKHILVRQIVRKSDINE